MKNRDNAFLKVNVPARLCLGANLVLRRYQVLLLGCGVWLLSGMDVIAQELHASTDKLPKKEKGYKPLLNALTELGDRYKVNFAYDHTLVEGKQAKVNEDSSIQLEEQLAQLLTPNRLQFKKIDSALYVIQAEVIKNPSGTAPVLEPDQKPAEQPEKAGRKITGRVVDEKNGSLPGVSVVVKGKPIGTITDANGNYALTIPDEETTLIFSSVGYLKQEIPVGNQTSINVALQPDTKALEEVIVVGYGTQKKSDLTGAISTVNAKDISKLPLSGIDQALQGQVSGVRVTQSTGAPGEGVSVRIRGVGTINDNSPLFIIDGVPTKDAFNVLSPADIESMSVLKDASSAAIYGARAANGVILVTTKKGKSGVPRVNFNAYAGVQQHGKLIDMANTKQYIEIFNEAVANDNQGVTNPLLLRKPIPDNLATADTDWQRAIMQTGVIQNYQLSVSGGTDKSHYLLSGTYFDQQGIILNSGYKRYTLRASVDTDVSSKLKIGTNLNLAFSNRAIIGSSGDGYGGNGGSVVRYALFRTPAIPIYDANGIFTDLPDFPQYFGDGYNPVGLALKSDNHEKQYRVFGNLFAEYQLLPSLKFRTDGGIDINFTNRKTFSENWGTNLRINSPSMLLNRVNTGSTLNWNNTLTYSKVFNIKHNLTMLVGTEAIKSISQVVGGTDRNYIDQIPSLRYLGKGVDITSKTSFEGDSRWALFSLFSRIAYSYDGKYLFTGNIRRDGSSRFSPTNRYGTFYSGGLGWNIDRETFFEPLNHIFSLLKLRASIGQLGNQDIGNYPWASIVGSGFNYPLGSELTANPGYTIISKGNSNVKWESSTQTDIGLETGFFGDQLLFTADYFIKRTTNMLIPIPVPKSGGSAAAPYVNAGSIENRGLELDLTYRKQKGDFTYSITANASFIKNKVLSLSDGKPIPGGRIDNGVFATLTEEGHSIGSFYLYQMEGIFQNDADIFTHAYQGNGIRPGDVKYKDINGDGIIDEKDRSHVGNAIPTLTYGLTANLQYKNFDASFFFQGVSGNKIYYQVATDIEGFYRSFNITKRVYDERWHGEGTGNTQPRVSWKGAANNKLPSTRFLEDGSYLRLKNLQIGYTLPAVLSKKIGVPSLRIYVSGQNLLTFTKYPGMDPEMQTSDNVNNEQFRGDVAVGIDWGTYPSARIYTMGININF